MANLLAVVIPQSYQRGGFPANGSFVGAMPMVKAFIVVTATDVDVHFYKLSAGGTLPPPNTGGAGGTSGSGGSGASSGGAGGVPAANGGDDSGGCGCRVTRGIHGGALLPLGLLVLAGWARRRRSHASALPRAIVRQSRHADSIGP